MKRVLVFLLTLGLVALLVGAGLAAYFSDIETSEENTFTAGTLDLQVGGLDNLATGTFAVSNLKPGDQRKGTFKLENTGSIEGYIDLENVNVTNFENTCVEPELEAGDESCGNPGPGQGELQNVVNLRLWVDDGCDGTVGKDERIFYDGLVKDLGPSFDLSEKLQSNSSICISGVFDWWSTSSDNLAQSDSMELSASFELGQDPSQ